MQRMKYPASLQPTTTETMTLPSGRSVAVPKVTPTFRLWRGDPVKKTYGKKAILDFGGRPAFAELAILWTLEKEGWQGFWVDTFGHHFFRTGYRGVGEAHKSLPQKPNSLPEAIWNLAKTRAGVWDVFCWQEDRVLFSESKRAGNDTIKPSQLRFAESALEIGLPLDSLLLVEWGTD
jgi:hypothetical protein